MTPDHVADFGRPVAGDPPLQTDPMSRILAVDYGERRIGVAISDPTGTIAQPLLTLQRRRGKRPPFVRIIEVMTEWGIEMIVVGLPIQADGEEGPAAEEVRSFGDGLHRRTQVAVEYWDERFSSARAKRDLPNLGLGATARRDKGRIDAMAAALILQSYLDAHRTK